MPSIEANGQTLYYEREGSGRALLLVMGLGAQLTAWPQAMVDGLVAQGFEVIRHDNRDAGLSSEDSWEPPSQIAAFLRRLFRRPIKTGYTIEDLADDAAGLIDALGLNSVDVVGASMGGMISQALAIRHPRKVRSLTSIMSNPGDTSGGIAPRLALALARRPAPTRETAVAQSVETFRLIGGPHLDVAEMRLRAEESVARSYRPAGVARQTAAIMSSPSRVSGLRKLEVPTLVVHGLVDPLVRPSGGIATAQAVPNSRLLMFNDMGHDLPAPRIDEIADAIVRNAHRASASMPAAR